MENYKKKYEQALDNFKKIKAANKDNKELVDFIEYEYPELKESEDERIRKSIIELVKQSSHILNPMNQKSMILWLEKQAEHNPIDKVEPKFKVGDIIKYVGEREEFSKEEHTIKKILDDCYLTIDDVYIPFKFEEYYILVNKNPSWSEEDEDMIDLLVNILEINHPDDYFKANQKDEVGIIAVSTKKIISWLKSIKERMKGE